LLELHADLNDTRRQAVHDAASSVGLVVLRLISEPTAAIMAHGIDRQGGERRVLVYDIGGTTTSVSVVDVDDDAIEVLASGYVSIGGLDFDRRIADYIMALYHERTGINIGDDSPALERLMSEVELAKRRLSSEISTEVTIEAFGITRSFSEIITRNKLEELISDLIDKTVELCDRTLNDAEVWSGDSVRKLQNEDINDVSPNEIVQCRL
jgi:molecular chaperone DnaK (HSP70)